MTNRFVLDVRRMSFVRWFPLVMLVGLMSLPSLVVAAGNRVAFVVGVGSYDRLPPHQQLKNTINDAQGVSSKLTGLGFDVMGELNLSHSDFNRQWQDVLYKVTSEDTFVFFFSVHGIQIGWQNYLLPCDIPFIEYGRQEELKREAISVNELLADLSTDDRPHPKRAVVILDACRDNPLIPQGYKGGNAPGGLANVATSDGIFVMYSAASNKTALDRLSPDDTAKYSVYTRTLLPLLERRDLTIQQLNMRLKDQVWALTQKARRKQRPTYYEGIIGRFCLPGCAEVPKELKKDPRSSSFTTLPRTMTGQDGITMVLVTAGEFTMGAQGDDTLAAFDERPAHPVYLDAFYIDQFEVTTSRYAKFFQETKRNPPQYWSATVLKEHGNKPVVGVTWEDAKAYCEWAGKRLPTEAEWEKAARGTDQRLYPWGNEPPNEKLANFKKCCDFKDYGVLTDVGSFDGGKSYYGVYDMAGNVWEWVGDWYEGKLYEKRVKAKAQAQNPGGPEKGESRVLRGGSWDSGAWNLRTSDRTGIVPTTGSYYDGFRCAQGAP